MPELRRVVRWEEIPEDTARIEQVWKALRLRPPDRPGPCWCNGPYDREEHHHSWCREARAVWRRALRALRKVDSKVEWPR